MPASLLSYLLIITIGSTVISSREGIFLALLSITALFFLGIHEVNHPELTLWKNVSAKGLDVFIDISFIFAISALSWISNSETEKSLKRARNSERLLEKEKEMLEVKVEERTLELKRMQEERVGQIYRFVEFGRVASGVFHDLMSPLNAIFLTIDDLKRGKKRAEEDGSPCLGIVWLTHCKHF